MEHTWFEVFKTGSHTDRSGKVKTWTDADLSEMAEKYNSQKDHEAPLVIGHPAENAPAWGWVDSLKAEGGKLYAKCRQIVPEFAEMVNSGMFKKRSISLYPDMLLRHVGFLGAQPPAVKGLKDFAFSGQEEDCPEYEYQEKDKGMELKELEEKLAASERAREAAEKTAGDAKAELARLNTEFSEDRKKARKKEIEAFVDGGVKNGKILPGWKAAGLVEFMCGIDEQAGVIEFAEGGQKPAAEWFREFLEGFSAHPLFKEMVKPENDNAADQEFAEEMKLADEIAAIAKGGR